MLVSTTDACPSFLSKKDVAAYPFFGTGGKGL